MTKLGLEPFVVDGKDYYSVTQFARIAGVPQTSVSRSVKSGAIPYITLVGRKLIPSEELHKLIQRRSNKNAIATPPA